jgi:thiosulfate/3-mercaptopyruvate sulfurtransferase
MLDSVGVRAFVLAGGIATYRGELEVGPDEGPSGPGSLEVDHWPPHRFATIDEVDRAIGDSSVTLVDARSAERFSGVENPIDERFGHVPGAVSLPALGALDSGLPRPVDALVAHFEAAGVDPHTEVIAYCGSGVSACLDLLALRRAGHVAARLYVGSWSEWGVDPQRPLETGQSSA